MLHPFTFDTADVPTGVTSVTLARKLRIDAIVYQCQRLELVPRETWESTSQGLSESGEYMVMGISYPKNDQFYGENEQSYM